MKACSWIVMALGCSAAGLAQTAGRPTSIPEHTAVEIELQESISSETLHAGQVIPFKVVGAVVVDGNTMIDAGAAVLGEVKSAHSAGAFRRAGSFDLALKPLALQDGTMVQLEFPRARMRGTAGEKTATGIVAAPLLLYYFPLMPFAIAQNSKKGAAYKVRAGERYLVYVVAQPEKGDATGERAPSPQ